MCSYRVLPGRKKGVEFAAGSDRLTIAAQPDCGREKRRGECQPDPETRRAQESPRSELCQRVDRAVSVEGEGVRSESDQAVLQQRGEMRSVESDLLDDTKRERRQHGP